MIAGFVHLGKHVRVLSKRVKSRLFTQLQSQSTVVALLRLLLCRVHRWVKSNLGWWSQYHSCWLVESHQSVSEGIEKSWTVEVRQVSQSKGIQMPYFYTSMYDLCLAKFNACWYQTADGCSWFIDVAARIFVQTWFSAANDMWTTTPGILLASSPLICLHPPECHHQTSLRASPEDIHKHEIYTSFAFICEYLTIFVMYRLLTVYLYPSRAQKALRYAETTLWELPGGK